MAFSLKQAQEYAFEHNFDLRNTAIDVQIASKEVKKNTAIGLPQISGGIDYMDNFVIPTSVIPNFLAFLDTTGNAPKYIDVEFGVRYNVTASLNATQLVYSGQYLVGLQTAKAYLATVKQGLSGTRWMSGTSLPKPISLTWSLKRAHGSLIPH
ncbi:MAG: hypothetical protein MZV63_10435 [Marinilabiliales bacterium]|nr:hypothetical protein [Marinilabiliales bacterium]